MADNDKKENPVFDVKAWIEEYPDLIGNMGQLDYNLMRQISDEKGISFALVYSEIENFLMLTDKEVEVDTVTGQEAFDLVEQKSTDFIKECMPEEFDSDTLRSESLRSQFPKVRRDALNQILNSCGLSSVRSVATASSPDTSPIVLEKVIRNCVSEIIRNRVRGDFDSQLPEYFYAAVKNPNAPRHACSAAFAALIDPKWQVDMMQTFASTIVSKITTDCLKTWKKAHDQAERQYTEDIKVVDESKPLPSVRRLGDLEGGPEEE